MATKTDLQRVAPSDNLTPQQASTFLNVPDTTLAVWRSTHRVVLPYFKLGGHVRYRRNDLEAFIAANMRCAVTEGAA